MTAAKDLNPVDARKNVDSLRNRYLATAVSLRPKLDKN